MYQYGPPLEIADFSGGVTDSYIDGPINQGEEFDNLFIQKNKKLKTRPGRTFYISAAQAQLPSGNQRISALIKHLSNVDLFAVSGRKLYTGVTGSWTEVAGPVSSNPALSAHAVTNYLSWADWRGHTFITSDSFADPVKVYKNENGAVQVRTAGMPPVTLEGAIDLANDLKTKFNLHRADAAQHTTAVDNTNSISAATATDFDSLSTLVNQLITKYTAHNADADLLAAWLYHAAHAPASKALASTTSPTTLVSICTILDDLRTKYNAHDADGTAHAVASSHQVTAQRLPQLSGTGGTANYLYRLLYYYQYYVSDVLEEDFGPTLELTLSNVTTGTKSIANIPAIANGSTRCYDTANIKVKIYRTVDAGSDFYYVGQVTNGTTTFSDTVTDATLITNDLIYTAGGILDNDPPPRAKFITVANDFAVYSNLKIGTQNYPNSFSSSIPSDIDSAPGSFQDEIDVALTGASTFGIYHILFGRNRITRLEGFIDEQGRGAIFKKEVSRTHGTISNNSIVQIPQGLVFAGEDGFYFCDGFNPPQILSIHLIETFKTLISVAANEKKIYGEYDSLNNRVFWTTNLDSSASDNDSIFVLDLNYALSPESVYTTQSAQGTSFRPTALSFFNREMVQADSRGYVFKYDDNTATDPKVDTSATASHWTTYAIINDYKSCAYNFGTDTIFKWVPLITAQFKNDVNTTISILSNNADSGLFKVLKEIRSRELITWGDPSVLWGSTEFDYFWNVANVITAKRRFPAGQMRCLLKQIQITNAYTIVFKSDDFTTASINPTNKTAELVDPGVSWPDDIADYYVSFSEDEYVNEFLITSRNSNTLLTFSDPNNAAVVSTGDPGTVTVTNTYGIFTNGVNGKIDIGTGGFNPEKTDIWSISAWFKSDAGLNSTRIIGPSNFFAADPYLTIDAGVLGGSDGGFGLLSTGGAITFTFPSTTASPTAWNHIAVTSSGSGTAAGILVYINGALVAKTVVADTIAGGDSTINPNGSIIGDGTNQGGSLDEVGIFGIALTPTQIAEIISAGRSGDLQALSSATDLDYWYRLDNDGTDETGNHDGTATNVTYGTDTSDVVTPASSKWLIRGYAKGELMNIISYAIKFAPIGQIHTTYKGVTGGNT